MTNVKKTFSCLKKKTFSCLKKENFFLLEKRKLSLALKNKAFSCFREYWDFMQRLRCCSCFLHKCPASVHQPNYLISTCRRRGSSVHIGLNMHPAHLCDGATGYAAAPRVPSSQSRRSLHILQNICTNIYTSKIAFLEQLNHNAVKCTYIWPHALRVKRQCSGQWVEN